MKPNKLGSWQITQHVELDDLADELSFMETQQLFKFISRIEDLHGGTELCELLANHFNKRWAYERGVRAAKIKTALRDERVTDAICATWHTPCCPRAAECRCSQEEREELILNLKKRMDTDSSDS